MHKSDKAPEPSMEEILASIRKIIAEEPIGSRPGPTSATPNDRPSSTARPLAQDNARPEEPPYSVEDALADLMGDQPRVARGPERGQEPPPRVEEPPAPAAPAPEGRRTSWLFGRASSTTPSAPPQTGPLPGFGRAPTSGPREQLDAGPAPAPAPAPAKAEGEPPVSKPVQQPHEARSLFGARPHGEQSPLASFPTAPANQSQELPRPAPQRFPAREPSSGVPAGEQRETPAQPSPQVGPQSAAPIQAKAAPEPAPQPGPVSGIQRREASALDQTATRPERTEQESKPLTTSATAAIQSGATQQAGVAEPAAAASPKTSGPAPQARSSGRTLEETVVELLRPMLREWLDANMPHIVEKALRAELSSISKRPAADDTR